MVDLESSVLGVAKPFAPEAAELSLAGFDRGVPGEKTSYEGLVRRVMSVESSPLDPAETAALNELMGNRNPENLLKILDARTRVIPLFKSDQSTQIDYDAWLNEMPGATPEEKLRNLRVQVVAGVSAIVGSDQQALERQTMMAEGRTPEAALKDFQRQEASVARLMRFDAIDPNNPESWLSPRDVKERIADAFVGSQIDPRGFPSYINQVLRKSPRFRVFVPDVLSIYPEARGKIEQVFKALETSTSASGSVAEGGMRPMLTGADLRSVVSTYWKPIAIEAGNFRQTESGLWVAENKVEKPLHLSVKEALDFETGNAVEFKERSEGKIFLEAQEQIRSRPRRSNRNEPNYETEEQYVNSTRVIYEAGDQFTLFEDIDERIEQVYGDSVRASVRGEGLEGEAAEARARAWLDNLKQNVGNNVREQVLSRTVATRATFVDGAPNPYGPQDPNLLTTNDAWRAVPGEWVLTIEEIFKIMDGQNPLRDYYLRRAGVDLRKIVGHRTISGTNVEQSSVLQWDNNLLLGYEDPHDRSALVGIDLLPIRSGAFYTDAMYLLGVTQWDAFFDPAMRTKQHLESSMRSVLPEEYVWRHAITDKATRDLAMATFTPLFGRKLSLNAYIFALRESAGRALKGKVVPEYSNKRIDDMTDPLGLEGEKQYLGLIDMPPATTDAEKAALKEGIRVLEHYEIARREHPGMYKDVHDINKIYYEAHWIAEQVANNRMDQSEADRRLSALRIWALKNKRSDYMVSEDDGAYYWEKRSPFENPRPAVEQAAMLGAMGKAEAAAIKDFSHKNLIVSLGGPSDLPDWAYKGWYGKLLSLKYANSFGFFMYGDDKKLEQMQLKYMGQAGDAFKYSLEVSEALVQSLNPRVMEAAGVDVDTHFWADDLGEKFGAQFADTIMHEVFGTSGKRTMADYFKRTSEAVIGRANAQSYLPGEVRRGVMHMYARQMYQVVEGGLAVHFQDKFGLGSPGSEGNLLRLDYDSPVYGDVDRWMTVLLRECGHEVVVPANEDPYISAQGHKVVYGMEGIVTPGGEFVVRDDRTMELQKRYLQRRFEIFSTNVFTRVMEEVLRDATVFDVADRKMIFDYLDQMKHQARSRFEEAVMEVQEDENVTLEQIRDEYMKK